MNGAWASRASRRAISVFPTPVGPIMMMFFGATSSRELGREVLAPPAIPERDGDRALGLALPDDVAIELGHDLGGRQLSGVGPGGHSSSTVTWSFV